MVNDMPAYRLSKIALNGLTLMLVDSVKDTNVLINPGCPGWVRTVGEVPMHPVLSRQCRRNCMVGNLA
jgi:NAD(P)-dependent dehydrogenase (short-subunit alcohol dehydrogenase family)